MLLHALVELERRDEVVGVVGEGIRDRALVAVIRREMEDVVEPVVERLQHFVIGDRALEELDPWIVGNIRSLGREQVVDDGDASHVPP